MPQEVLPKGSRVQHPVAFWLAHLTLASGPRNLLSDLQSMTLSLASWFQPGNYLWSLTPVWLWPLPLDLGSIDYSDPCSLSTALWIHQHSCGPRSDYLHPSPLHWQTRQSAYMSLHFLQIYIDGTKMSICSEINHFCVLSSWLLSNLPLHTNLKHDLDHHCTITKLIWDGGGGPVRKHIEFFMSTLSVTFQLQIHR